MTVAVQRQPSDQLGAVQQHLAALAADSAELPDVVSAVRHVMGNYSETGTPRVLECQTEHVKLDGFSAEWIFPAGCDESRRGVYLHGGGWIAGSPDTHRHIVHLLAIATGRPILLVDYRLAPEHPFPQGLKDCVASLEYAFANGPSGAGKAANVVMVGDSAGGNLVAAVVIHAIQHGTALPSAAIMMSAALDFRPYPETTKGLDDAICSGEGFNAIAEVYLPATATIDDPLVSPPAASDTVLAQFPPSLLQTSSVEYLRDQSVSFAERLWAQGVPTYLSVQPGLPHAYHLFPQELAGARFSIQEIVHFLETAGLN